VLSIMVKAFVFIGIFLLYLVYALIVFWKSLRYVILGPKDEQRMSFLKSKPLKHGK
jgi:hypothetical protein